MVGVWRMEQMTFNNIEQWTRVIARNRKWQKIALERKWKDHDSTLCQACTGGEGWRGGINRKRWGKTRVRASPQEPQSPRKEVSEHRAGAASRSWDKRGTCLCVLSRFSRVQLCATLWTVARWVPLSLGFSRQEYWSGLPCLSPGDLLDSGMKPESLMSPALAGGLFTTSTAWKDQNRISQMQEEKRNPEHELKNGVNRIRY